MDIDYTIMSGVMNVFLYNGVMHVLYDECPVLSMSFFIHGMINVWCDEFLCDECLCDEYLTIVFVYTGTHELHNQQFII